MATDLIDEFVRALSEFATGFIQDKIEEQLPQQPRTRRVNAKAPKQEKAPKQPKAKREPELLYNELEVSPRASAETIRAAYLSLSKRYHPDVAKHKGAAERMKRINAAFEILSNAEKRKAYDAKIRSER